MTTHDAPPVREPVSEEEADALRALAARERDRAATLAGLLEDIALNGLPAPEECRPWEEIREEHFRRLAGE
ncbi:hypothetical protein GCM10018781_03920 [Kitasatospora indigofera]|uniref:Uncharacterized protein n=1 Tax=Kitasatospora indigofera TaxID=67307 RepID=A0A919KKJ2_9ACTN|nr:hypothetical protein [Kitasatospora indigofera]GHH59901.1 hypothetical protein GCM10018781_03920 [Kitasatospora indigofera]